MIRLAVVALPSEGGAVCVVLRGTSLSLCGRSTAPAPPVGPPSPPGSATCADCRAEAVRLIADLERLLCRKAAEPQGTRCPSCGVVPIPLDPRGTRAEHAPGCRFVAGLAREKRAPVDGCPDCGGSGLLLLTDRTEYSLTANTVPCHCRGGS